MNVTPINMAEAIIEPFWDPRLSGLANWTIMDGQAHGLAVRQGWCYVQFAWSRKPAGGPALAMDSHCSVSCRGFDHLMLSLKGPAGCTLSCQVETDAGPIRASWPIHDDPMKEYVLPIAPAVRIDRICIELDAAAEGPGTGWINWIGLQQADMLERYLRQWDRFSSDWAGYLKDESYQPEFSPAYGIVAGSEDIDRLRQHLADSLAAGHRLPVMDLAAKSSSLLPEKMVSDFVNFWTDTRYCRDRDVGHLLLRHGVYAATAGILQKDAALLRLGARYALALAHCDHWDDGMICAFPGSTFEHRCFVQTLCLHETGMILDLAGELFTDLGRDLILRRIAEEGIGSVNYNVWKHKYIFHCNQLVWFSPGRVMGYAVLMQHMPRVRPYMDLAFRDIVESLELSILPDGGYVEGPTYFGCVGGFAGTALYYYAKASGLALTSIVPAILYKTSAFAEALASTDHEADFIPICDGRPLSSLDHLVFMAHIMPDSLWRHVCQKALQRHGGYADSLVAMQLDPGPALQPAEWPPLVILPVMNVCASHRRIGSGLVKILIMGNKAGAGHAHEDKGSFVLEFAGETYAMDPGTCDYSSPLSLELKEAQRHNMLIPTGTYERPAPDNPLMVDVRPVCSGDAVTFQARIDATPGWSRYYKRWVRRWQSPAPDLLVIEDDYELNSGTGVAFYWQTHQSVSVSGSTITLTGRHGRAELSVPDGWSVALEELPLLDGPAQKRIAISKPGRTGHLRIVVKLMQGSGLPG